MLSVKYKSTKIKFNEFAFNYDTAKGQIPLIPRIGDAIVLNYEGTLVGIVSAVLYRIFDESGKYNGNVGVEIWLS